MGIFALLLCRVSSSLCYCDDIRSLQHLRALHDHLGQDGIEVLVAISNIVLHEESRVREPKMMSVKSKHVKELDRV